MRICVPECLIDQIRARGHSFATRFIVTMICKHQRIEDRRQNERQIELVRAYDLAKQALGREPNLREYEFFLENKITRKTGVTWVSHEPESKEEKHG